MVMIPKNDSMLDEERILKFGKFCQLMFNNRRKNISNLLNMNNFSINQDLFQVIKNLRIEDFNPLEILNIFNNLK